MWFPTYPRASSGFPVGRKHQSTLQKHPDGSVTSIPPTPHATGWHTDCGSNIHYPPAEIWEVYNSVDYMPDSVIDKLGMSKVGNGKSHSNSLSIAEEDIASFMANYRCEFPWATVLPKMHIMEDHTIPWLRHFHVGAGICSRPNDEAKSNLSRDSKWDHQTEAYHDRAHHRHQPFPFSWGPQSKRGTLRGRQSCPTTSIKVYSEFDTKFNAQEKL